jgi:sulfur-oxidizing protein SoxX
MRVPVFLALALAAGPALAQQPAAPVVPQVVDDSIPRSLTGQPGDATRGRAIVANRSAGLCLLCHSGPIAEERFQGDLAPSLAGAGSRWSEGQLRLRIVDGSRLNADTIMPPTIAPRGCTGSPAASKAGRSSRPPRSRMSWPISSR